MKPGDTRIYEITLSDWSGSLPLIVTIRRKSVRNINLYVKAPRGDVVVTAPWHIPDGAIVDFLFRKKSWIDRHRERFLSKDRECEGDLLPGSCVLYRGDKFILDVVESRKNGVELSGNRIILFCSGACSPQRYRRIFEEWQRRRLREELAPLVDRWERILKVKANEVRIKKMKTRWGSCNPSARRIWINLRLIEKSSQCLEYILVHEYLHFFERRHNARFRGLMDRFLPRWREIDKECF